ncbi:MULTISPECIES: S26 family signal peptidase [Streptomyces]|uniref:S26 family signal peptidase n=1 Tax=Streptomyces solicathayae TaxID=3081768 RepID=A0ABZ0M2B8_9ACTN|nr:S26 family signal peptidase [Streptomyces sp. HUAS YS2]WOX25872.1 S26 family signal peptidase [Streptomyces sp. HUAS YS2]
MLVVAAAVAAAVRIRTSVVVVSVRGNSMAPAIRDGERVVVRRRPLARIRRGDVVVLRPPETSERDGGYGTDRHGAGWNVKRVTALPGEPVPAGTAGAGPRDTVPPGSLVVRGDNPDSIDSRHRGFFPGDQLLGTVVRRLGAPRAPGA